MVYGIVIVVAVLGTPYLLAAADGTWWEGIDNAARPAAGLVVALPALSATVLLLAARNAAWHGPVGIDLPTAFWALPQPLVRRRLLLPRLAATVIGAGLVGAMAGAMIGFVLGTLPAGSALLGAGAGAWAGATLGLACVLVGVVVERYDGVVLRLGSRLFAPAWAAVGALCALGVWALVTDPPGWLGAVLLWSGPWGWAVQPLVAVVDASAPLWAPAVLIHVALLAMASVWCVRAVPAIPGEALRRRARVSTQVTASMFSLELRQAKLTIQSPHRRGQRALLRLPVPRRPWLLVPWRDATGLLRTPGRLAWAAVALAFSVTATAAAGPLEVQRQVLLSVLAMCALYFCVAQLAEPARVDSDNPRRATPLAYSRGSLALWHGVVPTFSVLAALVVAGPLIVVLGAWHPGWLVVPLSVPAMVGAALVSAYRGSMPAQVAIGVETPFGNTASLQMAAWYLRGPLGALLFTVPVLAVALHRGGQGLWWGLWLLPVGAAQLLWAWRSSRQES